LGPEAGARFVEKWRARLDGRSAQPRPRADVVTLAVDGGAVLVRESAFELGARRAGRSASPLGPGLEPARGFHFPGLAFSRELEPGVDWFTPASCGAPAGELPDRFWS